MKQQLQLLIGPVGSGKSTYSQNAARNGMVIVSDDAIVNSVHAGQYSLYSRDLKPVYKSVENQIATSALGLGRSVVVDRGVNNSVGSRRRWIGLSHSMDVPAVAIVFDQQSPEVQARRRFESDSRGYSYDQWLRIAQHHQMNYQPPKLAEGFDGIVHVLWDEVKAGWCSGLT